MVSVERIGAFVEYILRPMTDDIRRILEYLKQLDLPITETTIKRGLLVLIGSHLFVECLRAGTYIVIALIVCRAVIVVLS